MWKAAVQPSTTCSSLPKPLVTCQANLSSPITTTAAPPPVRTADRGLVFEEPWALGMVGAHQQLELARMMRQIK